jgi:endonuclease III
MTMPSQRVRAIIAAGKYMERRAKYGDEEASRLLHHYPTDVEAQDYAVAELVCVKPKVGDVMIRDFGDESWSVCDLNARHPATPFECGEWDGARVIKRTVFTP